MIRSIPPCSADPLYWRQRDPTIAEILADSVVKAIMAADRVDPAVLLNELTSLAGRLGSPLKA
jgi:hypothetical protein